MNYAIEFTRITQPFLTITSRKRSLKHLYIFVETGSLLVRLGKHELAVTEGQAVWLPFNTLYALTTFPNTSLVQIEFSCRLKHDFVSQGGRVEANQMVRTTIERLISINDEEYRTLLQQVLLQEVLLVKPALLTSALCEALRGWSAESQPNNIITKEIDTALRLREAIRLSRSGKPQTEIVDTLFDGDSEQLSAIAKVLLSPKDNQELARYFDI